MPDSEAVALLRSMDTTLKAILVALRGAPAAAGPAGGVAPDSDLDGQWGNPEVKAKDPKDWHGPTMKGRKFSECPAEYLELVAERLDYFAGKEEDAKKKRYQEMDAKRARGWAKRIRDGRHTPAPVEESAEIDI